MRKKKFNFNIFIIGAIVLLFASFYYGSFLTIITPPTRLDIEDGRVFWIATLSVDSINEVLTYRYTVGDNVQQSINVGDKTIEPQESFSLGFSAKGNFCRYNLQEKTVTGLFGATLNYIEPIADAERVIEYEVTNSKTLETKQFSAFDTNPKIFEDVDNKGEVIVQSAGSLQGMRDCPGSQDVAFCRGENNRVRLFDKDAIFEFENNQFVLGGNVCDAVADNRPTNFGNNFVTYVLETDSTQFNGFMENNALGTALVSVRADQDFFDSVVYTPEQVSKPNIKQIEISSLVAGKQGTARVIIENDAEVTSTINVDISSQNLVFTPSTKTLVLSDSIETYFMISTPNFETQETICVEATSSDSFGNENTDKLCKNVAVIVDGTKDCGNGICEPEKGENSQTCQVDCPVIDECSDIPYSYYEPQERTCVCREGRTMVYDQETDEYKCVQQQLDLELILLIGFGVLIVALSTILIFVSTGKGRKR